MRIAVYWAPPPRDPFWLAGSRWLGRDAASGEMLVQPSIGDMLGSRLAELTAAARHYGWHATVHAPFMLQEWARLIDVHNALRALLARFTPFLLTLQPDILAGFCALRPVEPVPQLQELAAACVLLLDRFAMPLDPKLAAARGAHLSAREQELNARWGYPYVFEHYRFHCTLAAPASAEEQPALLDAARLHFGAQSTVSIGGLALFVEPDSVTPFRYQTYLPMGALPIP